MHWAARNAWNVNADDSEIKVPVDHLVAQARRTQEVLTGVKVPKEKEWTMISSNLPLGGLKSMWIGQQKEIQGWLEMVD